MINFQTYQPQHGENSLIYPKMKRWDHSGFDQLQIEEKVRAYKEKTHKKQKNHANKDNKRGNQKNNSRWWTQHKQENEAATQDWNDSYRFDSSKRDLVWPKSNKPDRQIYSVRDKMAGSQNKDVRNRKHQGQEKTMIFKGKVQEIKHVGFDNNSSFVSNVSTTISERVKSFDDNRDQKSLPIANDSSLLESPFNVVMHGESRVLFAINLNSQDNYETIFVYEDEDDYENLLNGVCQRHSITSELALAFKINLVQMICDAHSNPSQIESILSRLLEENFKTILLA